MGVELTAMSDNKLDRMRGGFSLPNGLQISFGIERAVYVNGNLVSTTSLNIVDLAKAVSAAAAVGCTPRRFCHSAAGLKACATRG